MRSPILDVNGKVRAQQGAQAAMNTVQIIDDFGGMVSFGVRTLRHYQQMPRAELNTETASLASFLNDMHNAMGDLNSIPIERLSPIRHRTSSTP